MDNQSDTLSLNTEDSQSLIPIASSCFAPSRHSYLALQVGICCCIAWNNALIRSSEDTSISDPTTSATLPSISMRPTHKLLQTPHHDLQTFLIHAARTGTSQSSSVFLGTRYEYQAQASLRRFGISLDRVGGAGDLGVDLRGVWTPPPRSRSSGAVPKHGGGEGDGGKEGLRVFVQCKRALSTSSVGPKVIRELEGAADAAADAQRRKRSHEALVFGSSAHVRQETQAGEEKKDDAIALLVTLLPATKGIREAMRRSKRALAYATMDEEGIVGSFFWNNKSKRVGLGELGTVTRYKPMPKDVWTESHERSCGNFRSEVVLTWRGETWEPLKEKGEG